VKGLTVEDRLRASQGQGHCIPASGDGSGHEVWLGGLGGRGSRSGGHS
jgi:hypothetical protein